MSCCGECGEPGVAGEGVVDGVDGADAVVVGAEEVGAAAAAVGEGGEECASSRRRPDVARRVLNNPDFEASTSAKQQVRNLAIVEKRCYSAPS
jgi:hypothetical protein